MRELTELIPSASMTADAWQDVAWIVTTIEDSFHGTGGQLSVTRNTPYRHWTGQPTIPLLAVLPFDYFPISKPQP